MSKKHNFAFLGICLLYPATSTDLKSQITSNVQQTEQQYNNDWSGINNKLQSGEADGVVRDQLANPLDSALPSIPNPNNFNPAEELISQTADFLKRQFAGTSNDPLTKTQPPAEPLKNFGSQVSSLLDQMSPRTADQAKAQFELDKAKITEDFSKPNLDYCKGIPPLVCNKIDGNSYECAGGRMITTSSGVPWDYTLVSKCNGTRFVEFSYFERKVITQTRVPVISNKYGGVSYSGQAFAGLCAPCPKPDLGKAVGDFLRGVFRQ